MYIPIWVIILTLLTAAIAVILWQQGKKPSDWYERVIEVVGKPYVLCVFIGAAAIWGAAIWFYLLDIIKSVHHMVGDLSAATQSDVPWAEKNLPEIADLAQASAVLLATLAAAATLFFTLIKTWINERTTTAEEEGLITDRINAAVASLGAEKTIKEDDKERTVPNIEVRIGAILALERIAKKNADVHIQIMEILTAYIRENAPVTEGDHDRKPRHDIQLAFTVIGRRPPKRIALERMHDFRLDLSKCDLTRIDGQGLNFAEAQFENSKFSKAKLDQTNLFRANLQNTFMWEARLKHLQGANLTNSRMQGARLINANLKSATLVGVNLEHAILTYNVVARDATFRHVICWHTNLEYTNLRGANIYNLDLGDTRLPKPDLLNGASVRHTNLSETPMAQDQLNVTFGDGSVTLPDSITWPSHWPKEELSDDEFHTKWEEWKKTLPPDGD